MDPDIMPQLAMMLGIDSDIFEANVVEVAAAVKRNGGDVDDAAAALDAYLKKLFEAYSGEEDGNSQDIEMNPEDNTDVESLTGNQPESKLVSKEASELISEEEGCEELPHLVDAYPGMPTIRDVNLHNPLPNAYYAVKYHGYAKCSQYFHELIRMQTASENGIVKRDYIYQYDPKCLVDWLPLRGYKPGTSCSGEKFLWQNTGTSYWSHCYPKVGINSEYM